MDKHSTLGKSNTKSLERQFPFSIALPQDTKPSLLLTIYSLWQTYSLILCNAIHSQDCLASIWCGNAMMELWPLLFTASSSQVSKNQVCLSFKDSRALSYSAGKGGPGPLLGLIEILLKLCHLSLFTLIKRVPSFPQSSCFLALAGSIYFHPPALSCFSNNRTQIEWAVSQRVCKGKKYCEGAKGNISKSESIS